MDGTREGMIDRHDHEQIHEHEPHKVNLHLGDLSRPMADNIPDVLTDMLELAAYVYCPNAAPSL
jgi:hypothetical protein